MPTTLVITPIPGMKSLRSALVWCVGVCGRTLQACHTHRRGCAACLLVSLLWALITFNQTLHVWSLQWQDCTHQPQHRLTIASAPTLGLGNDLFKMAAVLSLYERWNASHVICLQRFNKVFMTFDLPQIHYCDPKYLCDPVKFKEKYYAKYGKLSSPVSHDVILFGYFQSWKYFIQHESKLRLVFTFKLWIRQRAEQILMRVLRMRGLCRHHELVQCLHDVTLVGVHVRHGDYLQKDQMKYGFKSATYSYIKTAMMLFRNETLPLQKDTQSTTSGNAGRGIQSQNSSHFQMSRRRVVFVVVSDDLVWCQRHLANQDVVIVPRGGFYGTDLAVLAACQHSVITVGTFGWWGAWLAGGSTVYYKGWPRLGSPLDGTTSHADYYPPHWIGLQ